MMYYIRAFEIMGKNFYAFSDDTMQQAFEEKCLREQLNSTFYILLAALVFIAFVPGNLLALLYNVSIYEAGFNYFLLTCITCFVVSCNLKDKSSTQNKTKIIISEKVIASCSMVVTTLWLVLVCFQNRLIAPLHPHHYWSMGRSGTSMSVPISPDLMVILVAAPFYFMFALGESRYLRIVFFVVAVSAAMLSVVISHQVYFQIPSILFWTLISLITSFFSHQQRMNFFATQRKLDSLQQLEEKINQQSNAMRHLIGNVAHDLKTPLASFTSGIELINSISSSLTSKAKKGAVDSETASNIVKSMEACIKNIRNTNTFMLMTIHRVLDYTKSQEGMKLIPKNETIDLLETLTLPLNCMRNIQDRVAVVLKPIVDPICSHIITDKQWLQENVLCLLSNAVKYSEEGYVSIALSLVREDEITAITTNPTQSYFRIEIDDHGIGMTDEVMHGLFNQFQQAQRLAGGTGLGLYSLSKRVDAIQGKYGVQRRRDGEKGSLFWFAIPYKPDPMVADMIRLEKSSLLHAQTKTSMLEECGIDIELDVQEVKQEKTCFHNKYSVSPRHAESAGLSHIAASCLKGYDDSCDHFTSTEVISASASTQSTSKSSAAAAQSPNQGNIFSCSLSSVNITTPSVITIPLHILLVDDSAIIIKMSKNLLMRQGHQVMVAENGATAIRKLQDQWEQHGTGFDLVIMDLQMPVMDGLEAIKRWRAIESKGIMVQKETMTLGLATASLVSIPSPLMIHQPIIGMSANSDPETIQIALQAGFDAFIAKPFTMDIFQEIFRSLQGHEK